MSNGGKGSAPRPYSVDQKTFANNWNRIFGQAQEPEDKESPDEHMTRLPDNHPLRGELAAARAKVSGKTFAQASELFKDIESVKVRIRHAEGKYKWMARA